MTRAPAGRSHYPGWERAAGLAPLTARPGEQLHTTNAQAGRVAKTAWFFTLSNETFIETTLLLTPKNSAHSKNRLNSCHPRDTPPQTQPHRQGHVTDSTLKQPKNEAVASTCTVNQSDFCKGVVTDADYKSGNEAYASEKLNNVREASCSRENYAATGCTNSYAK